MKKKIYVASTLPIIIAVVLFYLYGFGTSKTYRIPYLETENILLSRLHLNLNELVNRPLSVQAKADDVLAKSMRMKLYAVTLDKYEPNNQLSFTCYHRYNIGAVGEEYIHFDIIKLTPTKTSITVNYSDRWKGVFPPFVFWNPGLARERHIHSEVWGAR